MMTPPQAATLLSAFILVYGPPGIGKTVDCGYSFPTAAWLVGEGSLKSVESVCGYNPYALRFGKVPNVYVPTTLPEATQLIRALPHDIIVTDDFSWLAELSMNALERRFKGNSNKYAKFDASRDEIMEFRDAARASRKIVVLNAWETAPKYKDGSVPPEVVLRGGPKLQGDLPEKMPGLCDIVFRARVDALRKPWGACYESGLSAEWVLKDRHNTIPVNGLGQTTVQYPMNLGEVLRAAGYRIPRHPEVAPWQEDVVEATAQQFLANAGQLPTIGKSVIASLRQAGISDRWIQYTLRDALARMEIRKAQSNILGSFGWGA